MTIIISSPKLQNSYLITYYCYNVSVIWQNVISHLLERVSIDGAGEMEWWSQERHNRIEAIEYKVRQLFDSINSDVSLAVSRVTMKIQLDTKTLGQVANTYAVVFGDAPVD